MPKFTTLEEAQNWIDNIGEEALNTCEKLAHLATESVVIMREPTQQECVDALLTGARNLVDQHLGEMAIATDIQIMGFSFRDLGEIRRLMLLACVEPEDLDAMALVPIARLDEVARAIRNRYEPMGEVADVIDKWIRPEEDEPDVIF